MNPLLLLFLVGGGAAVVVAVASSSPPKSNAGPLLGKLFTQRMVRNVPRGHPLLPNDEPFVGYVGGPSVAGVSGLVPGAGVALDLSTQRWAYLGTRWVEVTSSVSDWNAWVEKVATSIVPIMQTAMVTFGGPIGAVGAASISVMMRLSQGAKLTDALISEVGAQLKTYVEKQAIYKTAKTYAEMPATRAAIALAREKIGSGMTAGGATQTGVLQAFDVGVTLGRAQRVQRMVVERLKKMLTPAEANSLQVAFDAGINITDWCYAFGGYDATNIMDSVIAQVTASVEAGS